MSSSMSSIFASAAPRSLQPAEAEVYGGDGDVVGLLIRRDGLLDGLNLRLYRRDLLR